MTVKFTDPPAYYIGYCSNQFVEITNMPAEDTRVWTFTRTSSSLALACNGVEIFNYEFSSSSKEICADERSGDKVNYFTIGNEHFHEVLTMFTHVNRVNLTS